MPSVQEAEAVVQDAEAAVAQELEAQNDFDSLFVDVNILLFMHIAYFINDLFPLYVRLNCYGCAVDHPSQTQHSCIMEQTDTLLDIYLDDMLEDLIENRHDEIFHLWLTKVRENVELQYFYQDEDMAVIDLCNFLCIELQDVDRKNTLKQFSLHYQAL